MRVEDLLDLLEEMDLDKTVKISIFNPDGKDIYKDIEDILELSVNTEDGREDCVVFQLE